MNSKAGKLLVVESDDALREQIVAILRDAGYVVSSDYQQGMKAVVAFDPDVVVLGADPPQLDCNTPTPRSIASGSGKNPVSLQNVLYRTNRLTCGKLRAFWPTSSMLRRLDDRIRELCARAVNSQDPTELHNIFSQLRAAIKEHGWTPQALGGQSPKHSAACWLVPRTKRTYLFGNHGGSQRSFDYRSL
jgi:hypothetical protein